MQQLVTNILANDGAAVRVWLTEHTPTVLHGLVTDAPLWVLGLLAAFVAFGLVWAAVKFVTDGFAGMRWVGKLLTRPRQALREVVSPEPAVTQRDIRHQTRLLESLVQHKQHYHDTTKQLGSNPLAWLDEEIVSADLRNSYRIGNYSPAGTQFLLIPSESRFCKDPVMESVAISAPASIGPGPSDDRMYLVQPIDTKQPYHAPRYLPPYDGRIREPIKPNESGNFDYFPVFSRKFSASHMYGTARWVLQIWETYFGSPIEWHFKDSFDRLELIPFLDLENNVVTGYGFMEAGFITDPGHYKWPLSLNFDVIAHEMGHLILFSKLGMPNNWITDSEHVQFTEASCDLIALICALHFESTLDRVVPDLVRNHPWQMNKPLPMQQNQNDIEQITSTFFRILIDIFMDDVRGISSDPEEIEHVEAKTLFVRSRDLVGRMLAETWTRIPKEGVSALNAYRILNEIDKEEFGGEYTRFITRNFRGGNC